MTEEKRFRPNVCVVLTDDAARHVLVFRRADIAQGEHVWQFPQGGVKPGESPEAAMRRELEEEIGTERVVVDGRVAEPIRYEYPPEVLANITRRDPEKAKYQGQEQYWFRARLTEGTEQIRFDHHHAPEFNAFNWVTPEEALALVVPFKREAYVRGLTALGLLDGDPDATG